ncbi:acyloxyacyl hydrolase [Luteolibacter pohnpeiensis]|uniref:Acyloxyacyl hydrolase n=1 Tax=Luteolibacter pohnpeiensis TaxID=454153 RepID=A0A934VV70_9BACT|nr:acyloxyacyl hydrolase [Luteolibacter pohnpeiensis]MBK1883267.1 acyloxyacyl hydrolase [Luteolibacter pohnpeiensis]
MITSHLLKSISRVVPVLAFTAAVSPCAHASITFIPAEDTDAEHLWAFETGVAFITNNNINEIVGADHVTVDSGDAGGEVYSFTASRHLGDLRISNGNCTFQPQLELPLTLGIIDENSRDPFLEYRASFVVRWVDFPWNDYVKTTFATGLGLNYSSKIYLMDIQRHPDSDRSNLKFNWPIQLTLALPNHPEQELQLYIEHHSGGHVFDRGGINSLGIGYRRSF